MGKNQEVGRIKKENYKVGWNGVESCDYGNLLPAIKIKLKKRSNIRSSGFFYHAR